MKTTVYLQSGTVGEVISTEAEIKEGQTVTVSLHDENGILIKETGVIKEILEIKEDWE